MATNRGERSEGCSMKDNLKREIIINKSDTVLTINTVCNILNDRNCSSNGWTRLSKTVTVVGKNGKIIFQIGIGVCYRCVGHDNGGDMRDMN